MNATTETDALIAALAEDMKRALEKKSKRAVTALEERRHELLARHLGFVPKCPIEAVYVVGDSHALFFAGENGMNQVKHRRVGLLRPRYITRGLDLLPCFHTRHLGPATAWRAFDGGTSTRTREKIDALLHHELQPGNRVLLSFGEIDCRSHIPNAVLAGKTVKAAVEETVVRFTRVVDLLGSHELKVGVWGPASVVTKDQLVINHPLPAVGSDDLRVEIAQRFIECLATICRQKGVGCTSLAGTYHKWNERAEAGFFCDGFHLSQKLMPHALRTLCEAGVLDLKPQRLAKPGHETGL